MHQGHRVVAIVDDDPAVCRALRRLVLSLGYDAPSYPSGEALLAGMEAVLPTHILVDLHMPGLHGPALVERIRARASRSRIVVMTGLEIPGAREACLAAGADAYISKPVRSLDLQGLIESGEGPSPLTA